MASERRLLARIVLILLFIAVLGVLIVSSGVGASDHSIESAQDVTEEANFTKVLIDQSSHYPGDQNENNLSVDWFVSGAEAFDEVGAPNGFEVLHTTAVTDDWIDYDCQPENAAVFGIDRGNNNTGTQIDDGLVEHLREHDIRSDGMTTHYFRPDDFAGDTINLNPEDAIVVRLGAQSTGGPCMTATSEPGWYQTQGFVNGSTPDGEIVGLTFSSSYVYICECESEQEAEEQLGPRPEPHEEWTGPPENDGSSETTPTPTESTPSDQTDDSAQTPTPGPVTPTMTETPEGGASDTSDGDGGGDGGVDNTNGDDGQSTSDETTGNSTPTPGDGPGFGPVITLLALLTSGLYLCRRLT